MMMRSDAVVNQVCRIAVSVALFVFCASSLLEPRYLHIDAFKYGTAKATSRCSHTSHNTRAAVVIHGGLDAGYGQFTRDSAN
jgi:hypothetical protein